MKIWVKTWAVNTAKNTSKIATQKTAEATCDLISNKIADRITKLSKNSKHNNSEIVTSEHDKEIPKESFISPEERQKSSDDLRLI